MSTPRPSTADQQFHRSSSGVLRDQWRLAAGIVVACAAIAAAIARTRPGTAPDGWLYAALGLVVGLLGAAVVLLTRDRMDRRPRTGAELEQLWGLPVVAEMRHVGLNGRAAPEIVDGYRALRANLFLRSGGDLPRAVIVTSAVQSECNSAVAANLARALAASGYRVIAVSLDLRHPGLHRHMGIEDSVGIAELFLDDTHPRDVVTQVPLHDDDADGRGSLDLLADRAPTVERSVSLVSPAVEDLLSDLQEEYHVVVIDAPALLPASETALLAQRPGMQVLIVAQSGSTEPREIARARERLELAGVDPLGLVVCGVDPE